MNKKQCSMCSKTKDRNEFYIERRTKDGRTAHCKKCHMRKYKQKPTDASRRAIKKYQQSEKGKKTRARWMKRNPKKAKARHAISNAIYLGNIPPAKKLICANCGATAQQYHHPDYDKPLYVIPLCKRCHVEEHKNN